MHVNTINNWQWSILIAMLIFCVPAGAQNKISQAKTKHLIEAYLNRSRMFMNLETCGSKFDGPAYLLKQTENYSLDHLLIISAAQQQQLGKDIYRRDHAAMVVADDQSLPMLQKMVANLVSYSTNPKLNYHLYLIRSDEINAYSTIGGYIYITTAMLNFVDSKDELAFVLAHELTHILDNHVVRKIKKLAMLSYAGQKLNLEHFSKIALNLNVALSAPFDQIDEYEADRGGLELVQKAGYDQHAFKTFFTKLGKFERQDLLSHFTSTHPSSAHRMQCLTQLIHN